MSLKKDYISINPLKLYFLLNLFIFSLKKLSEKQDK